MVMDATQSQQPSPQSVGREFVRQYYTLLNKAPNHLHRFYNNNSSFIHGESTLVVGQKNIHNRIQQLNFHDCHAKISQVDAQATLGNGVVVQVTGELSNDGQPMRRFTQTFVLGAQSPKKYYVHNDIFRYQDLYSDEENDPEIRSENDDDLEQSAQSSGNGGDQSKQIVGALTTDTTNQLPTQMAATGGVMQQPGQQQQATAPQQHAIYFSMPAAGGHPVPVLATPQGGAVPLSAASFSSGAAAAIAPQQVQPGAVSQVNGVVNNDDLLAGVQQQQGASVPPAVGGSPNGPTSAPVATGLIGGSNNLATVPQNTSGSITNYQQTPLLQQTVSQHPIPQSASVSTMLPQGSQMTTTATNVDFDDGSNVASMSSNTEITAPTPSTDQTSIESTMSTVPIVEDFKTINEQQLQEKYEASKQQQNEPKTYANLFKSTSTSPSSFVNAALQQQQQVQQQQQQQQPSNNGYQPNTNSIPSATFTQSNTASMSTYIRNTNNTIDTNSNISTQGGPLPQRTPSSRMNKDYEQRRTSNAQQFGDNQQLFLGNIPHHASEDDLKTLFARFGTIVELRILSKPGGKLPPGVRNPLNYGFITYEDPESVQNCLNAGPLYYPENSPDGQKLNVEEKKPRIRSDLPPRQSMGNNMNSGGGSGMGGGQRNMSGGPQSRSLSNSGSGGSNSGMMRGTSTGNNITRGGSSSGQRLGGGGFSRNDNRAGSQSNGGSGGAQLRGANNNTQSTGGNNYAGRR